MNYFEENIKKKLLTIGFSNHNIVIDAACGTGEWSSILAATNRTVIAYDISKESINTAIKNYSSIKNLSFINASMSSSPIKKQTADAILCSGALMYVNPLATLKAFNKELNTKGIVYLSINGLGWILNCFFIRGIKNKDISKVNMAIRIVFDTLIRRIINPRHKVISTVFTFSDIKKLAEKSGFKVLHIGFEGTYLNPDSKKYQPIDKKTFLGITEAFEVVLQKHPDE